MVAWKQYEEVYMGGPEPPGFIPRVLEVRKMDDGTWDVEVMAKDSLGDLMLDDWILGMDHVESWEEAIEIAEAQFDLFVDEVPINQMPQP